MCVKISAMRWPPGFCLGNEEEEKNAFVKEEEEEEAEAEEEEKNAFVNEKEEKKPFVFYRPSTPCVHGHFTRFSLASPRIQKDRRFKKANGKAES